VIPGAILAAALTLATPASAQRGAQAIDGDTIRVSGQVVRLAGIDAPELHRPRCPLERAMARKARDRLQALVAGGVRLEALAGQDRYRRTLARVLDRRGRDVGQVLIAEGLAVPYHGRGPQKRWCE
jgi:endonuclease YncB( thermonuclease family)